MHTSAAVDTADQRNIDRFPPECTELRQWPASATMDYRLRDSTPQLQWTLADNHANHLDPALLRMKQGDYSKPVIADLNFLLVRWPNHIVGLRAVMDYEAAGGRTHGYFALSCYIASAKVYAPDDMAVRMFEGYYYLKKGDRQRAKAVYQRALELDPASIEAHYNLGLVYVDLADFDSALKHAHAAYAGGHPLPGLRRKLEKAGRWSAPPAARAGG